MDPLSFTASVIAVATLAAQCTKAFNGLRNTCKTLPGRLHALNNEVADVSAVLSDVAALVAERGRHSIPHDEQSKLSRVVLQLTTKLKELKGVVEALTTSCERSKVPLLQARAWSKVQERLLLLQDDIKNAKSQLNVTLGASNSRDLLHIRTQVQAISTTTMVSAQLTSDLREDVLGIIARHHDDVSGSLEQVNRMVDERISKVEDLIKAQEGRLYESQQNRLGPYYGVAAQNRRRRSRGEKIQPDPLPSRADAVGVRVARYATTCRTGCVCACHSERKSSTPALVDRVLGRLFIGYSGVPGLSPRCNVASCEISQTAHVSMEYWFPLGFFWSQIVRIKAGYQPNVGPQYQLTVMRRIPDNAQAVEFALVGNIPGLKDLMKRGLASPRDVSSTRGYTLLRWALYGKKHDAAKFLLQAGCDPDYKPLSPYEYTPKNKALDFLLQGHLTKDAEEALRPLALASDWVDDQDYTLIHKSVLALSSTRLEEAILQHPDDVDAVDALGRTALFWASARGDDRAVAILLASGADPNNMDLQLDTPLAHAADNGFTTCVRLLLESGADPDPVRPVGVKFSNPLNHAARNATDPLCVKTLLDFNADIESCGVDGRTPLIHVARTDNVSFALLLLEYGADVNATSLTGQTPLTTAIMHNSHRVLRLLLDRWFEYSECPRLKGGHLLQVVAEYGDLETFSILMAADHLKLMYDNGYGQCDYAQQLKDRFDADEKLATAFEELLSVINNNPDLDRSVDSLAEAGMLNRKTRAHKALGELPSRQNSSETDSDEVFENALEQLEVTSEGLEKLDRSDDESNAVTGAHCPI